MCAAREAAALELGVEVVLKIKELGLVASGSWAPGFLLQGSELYGTSWL